MSTAVDRPVRPGLSDKGQSLAAIRRRLSQCIAGIVFALLADVAVAHHSPVAFDTSVTDFRLSGVIESIDFRNPHSVMSLRVENSDGTQTIWDIEFSSVNLLLRRGWDFDRLSAGEPVVCTGNPSASGKNEMYMWSVELSDGTEFAR